MNDLISRRDVLDVIDKYILGKEEDETCEVRELLRLITKIYHMPSAQPERKKGKWIRKSPTAWNWTCSCCKKDNAYAYSAGKYYEPDVLQDLFCPNCGADMRQRGEQE